MNKLIVANWKMNAPDLKKWQNFRVPKNVDAVIAPPFTPFGEVRRLIRSVPIAAQDVFWEERGAYTGEVSAAMLKAAGAGHVIIGHSERRKWFHETDEEVHKKIRAALGAGLNVVLCVGESKEIRKKGLAAAKAHVKSQLLKDLKGIDSKQIIVAYEPIWAIGTGIPESPQGAAHMAEYVREVVLARIHVKGVRVIYGGSVNSQNIEDFVQYKSIDGALVGGASLDSQEFKKILTITSIYGN